MWQHLTFRVCEVDNDLPVTECVHRSPRPPVEHMGGAHVAGLQAVPSSETCSWCLNRFIRVKTIEGCTVLYCTVLYCTVLYPPHDPLLLVAGESIHQVVCGLEADVREEPRH